MILSSRPVSSPGRAENYPPLMVRFLRNNVSSKSKGRSRSGPIFVRRKYTPATTETQEPSSPKVTCMGQVRVTRRSDKPKPGPRPGRVAGRCGWISRLFSCHPFAGKLKPSCFRPVWRKWVSFSRFSFSRKSEKRSNSTRSESISRRSTVERDEPETRTEEEDEEEEGDSSKPVPSTPPRNALLLTRCRSAPYRYSSLASRFSESPVIDDQQEQDKETEQVQTQQNRQGDSDEAPEKMSVSVSESSTSVAETERFKDSSGGSERESGFSGGARTELWGSPRRRLKLTRCRSMPERTRERLVPELGLWKYPRLGFTF